MDDHNDLNEIWGVKETAKFLGRSQGAVRNLCIRSRIPFRKAAGRLVFIPDEIKRFVMQSPGTRPEDIE